MNAAELIREARKSGVSNPLDGLSVVTSGLAIREARSGAPFLSESAQLLRELNPRLSSNSAYFIADQINGWSEKNPEYAWGYTREALRQGHLSGFYLAEAFNHATNAWRPDLMARGFAVLFTLGVILGSCAIVWSFLLHGPHAPILYDVMGYGGGSLFAIGLFGSVWRRQ